jgi:ferric-dicitrate binding protein FerR (iron transport regulator)
MSWRSNRATSAMDEIIERSVRGEATPHEADTLAEWRHSSLANEQHYRRTVRLLEELRASDTTRSRPPSVETILKRRPAQPRRRSLRVPLFAAIALVVTAGLGIGLKEFDAGGAVGAVTIPGDGVGYATGASEMATIQLSDGSVVRLAPNTKLRFVQTRETREATLDGRAFFSVAHSPGRSFRVRTRFGDATVLGTKFELATDDEELKLVVVAGRVGLSGQSNQVEVSGGQQSGVRNGTALAPAAVPQAETMDQWVGKFLAFQDTPIREVAREISETYGVRVVVADSAVAGRTVNGTFTDREAKHVLELICLAVNARCETRPGEVVISTR